jgi:hypothetical protein
MLLAKVEDGEVVIVLKKRFLGDVSKQMSYQT